MLKKIPVYWIVSEDWRTIKNEPFPLYNGPTWRRQGQTSHGDLSLTPPSSLESTLSKIHKEPQSVQMKTQKICHGECDHNCLVEIFLKSDTPNYENILFFLIILFFDFFCMSYIWDWKIVM